MTHADYMTMDMPETTSEELVDRALLQELPSGYHYDAHLHQMTELILCLSGSIVIAVPDERVEVKAGEFLAVFPNVLHSGDVECDEDCRILHLRFSCGGRKFQGDKPSGEDAFLLETVLGKRKVLKGNATKQLEACVRGVCREIPTQKDGRNEMIASYITQILILLSRELSSSSNMSVCRNRYLVQATMYINRHYAEKISVVQVAEEVGVSARYLTRLFQAQLGLGVAAYITDVRISRSIDFMFRNPGYPLSQLATDIGFSSQQHFSRVFKEKMGVPPGKYFARLALDAS